jgi:hypothetical protein
MQSESPSNNGDPAGALPPVVPPSGKHIVQLFVVPGLIVAGIVVLFLGCFGFWGLFFGTSRAPQEYLADLDSGNPDVRWRAANDLAQVLNRDKTLASDPKLALKLSELLTQALDERDRERRILSEKTPRQGQQPLEDKNHKVQRKYIQFLSSCLGNMSVPAGAPAVARLAKQEAGPSDPVGTVLRRHAVWVLANMGESRKQFDSLPAERREAVLAELDVEAQVPGQRGDLARKTAATLRGKDELGVIRDLCEMVQTEASKNDSDPFLRRTLALALTFWEGTPADNELAEKALTQLARDNGRGTWVDVSEVD